MVAESIGRRALLRAGVGVAATAAVAACGSSPAEPAGSAGEGTSSPPSNAAPSPVSSAAPTAAAAPPAYVPYDGPKPDLPADASGVPAGYYHYPPNPPSFIDGAVGRGGTVTAMLESIGINVPYDKNSWWQGLNKGLGVDLKFNIVPFTDYVAKFQTSVAGGDIPDVAQVASVNQLPQVLEREFADLTEYLSGDAIKEYPGLAAFPSSAWKTSTVNGKIYGVAEPRIAAGSIMSTREDLLKKKGLSSDVGNGTELTKLLAALTDVKNNKYALGSDPRSWMLPYVLEMMGAPNGWMEKGGEFTSANEAPQIKDALDAVRKMWAAGYFHPESISSPASNLAWWLAGTTTLFLQGFAGWSTYSIAHPDLNFGVIAPPKWGGGGPAKKFLGAGAYPVFSGFKKAKPDRIKELLRVVDYIAAPFGTSEFLTVNYGQSPVDYTLKGSDPIPTKAGPAEGHMPHYYMGSSKAITLYQPGNPGLVKEQYDFLKAVMPTGMADPTLGLYSETSHGVGVSAGKTLSDLQTSIIVGRKPVSDWDAAVATWKQKAGDAERTEYEASFAASN